MGDTHMWNYKIAIATFSTSCAKMTSNFKKNVMIEDIRQLIDALENLSTRNSISLERIY